MPRELLVFSAHEILNELSTRVLERGAGGQRMVATEFGFSTAYLNDVLHGKRGISDEMAKRMGYRRIVAFVKEEE